MSQEENEQPYDTSKINGPTDGKEYEIPEGGNPEAIAVAAKTAPQLLSKPIQGDFGKNAPQSFLLEDIARDFTCTFHPGISGMKHPITDRCPPSGMQHPEGHSATEEEDPVPPPETVGDTKSYVEAYEQTIALLNDTIYGRTVAPPVDRLRDKVEESFPILFDYTKEINAPDGKFHLGTMLAPPRIDTPRQLMECMLTLLQVREVGMAGSPIEVFDVWTSWATSIAQYVFNGGHQAPQGTADDLIFQELAVALDIYNDMDSGVFNLEPEKAVYIIAGCREMGEKWLVLQNQAA